MKKEKCFFHLATRITMPWSREKKFFFSFSYYDHYAMLKIEKNFIHLATMFSKEERKKFFFSYSLQSLCHDQEWKSFLHLGSTFTTLWSREKKVFFSFSYSDHYAMIKTEKIFFSFSYHDHYVMIKREKVVFFI